MLLQRKYGYGTSSDCVYSFFFASAVQRVANSAPRAERGVRKKQGKPGPDAGAPRAALTSWSRRSRQPARRGRVFEGQTGQESPPLFRTNSQRIDNTQQLGYQLQGRWHRRIEIAMDTLSSNVQNAGHGETVRPTQCGRVYRHPAAALRNILPVSGHSGHAGQPDPLGRLQPDVDFYRLENFRRMLLADEVFRTALLNNLYIVAVPE